MATCKDCLHYDLCKSAIIKRINGFIKLDEAKEQVIKEYYESCNHFKDRSRFVEVPCKVGDRVYYIVNVNGKDEINSAVVQKVTIHFENEVGYDCGIGEIGFSNRSIGKRVFLTKEEAEQALAKRNQPDNTPQ